MEGVDELVRDFVLESYENLDQLDRDVLALESAPGSRELLGRVFRTIHTIKGTSGFFAFGRLERITHAGESLLAVLRDGRRPTDRTITDVLLLMVDTVRVQLRSIEASGREADVPVEDLILRLHQLGEGRQDAARPAGASALTGTPPTSTAITGAAPRRLIARPRPVPPAGPAPLDAVTPAHLAPSVPEPRWAPVPERFGARRVSRPAPHLRDERARASDAVPRRAAETSVRIDVGLLDALVRKVGELALARDEISRLAEANGDDELVHAARRLSVVASELQQGVMRTRMQPIENLWSKMPRVVRDLAAHCGRQVRLEVAGGDTEVERTLLEAVRDPLTHLVRNAVDHGIEPPEVRLAAGKAPGGELRLRAYYTGCTVVVEVADDGRGIDPSEVAAKAVERGLCTPDDVALMSPHDVLRLVLLPGLSTAKAVTNVSGRGVGMDVVRAGVEAIGGTVEIESVVGLGTTCRLRLPRTGAIMPAVLVQSAGETYAVPQACVLELVPEDGSRHGGPTEHAVPVPVHRPRGDLPPLLDLREVLEGPARHDDATGGATAILQSGTHRFGLVVDRVLGAQELVVEPLPPELAAMGTYAGTGLHVDGRISLILDVQAIAGRRLAGAAVEDGRRQGPRAARVGAASAVEQHRGGGAAAGRSA